MYKRILLKLSGESLAGQSKQGIDTVRLEQYAGQIKTICDKGIQVGIVIGGGNIFRGLNGSKKGFDRVKGDQMGMLATVINSLALCSALQQEGQDCQVLTSIRMEPVGELFQKDQQRIHQTVHDHFGVFRRVLGGEIDSLEGIPFHVAAVRRRKAVHAECFEDRDDNILIVMEFARIEI